MVVLPAAQPEKRSLTAAVSPSTSPSTAPTGSSAKSYSFAVPSLEGEEFSPKQFIRDHRPHAPLSVLRDDLRSHVSSLSAKIVQELQADFYHFIYPPAPLSEAPALTDAITPSLHTLRNRLEDLQSSLGTQAVSLRDSLAAHHDLLSRRSQLSALIEAHNGLAKLEWLLQSQSSNTSSSAPTTSSSPSSDPLAPSNLAHLQRVAAETAKLTFVISRAPKGPFLRTLTPRVSAVTRAARSSLEQVFHPALQRLSENSTQIARVLALFLAAGLPDAALDSFSRSVVAPFTATLRMSPMLAAAEKYDSSPTSTTPAHALRAAQRSIRQFLKERVEPVVSVIAQSPDLAAHLDVVGVAVWPAIQRALARQMAPAFSPGLPDVFHSSFLAGQDILSDVFNATDKRFRKELANATATNDFRRGWNLPVYFQLRFQEIASTFETRLEEGPITRKANALTPELSSIRENSSTDSNRTRASTSENLTRREIEDSNSAESHILRHDIYAADASAALVIALRRCWQPSVFLQALTHRFVRLSLQLLARYATWVRVGLAGTWPESDDSGANGAARIARDVATLQQRLPAELASVLRARLPCIEGESREIIDDVDTAFVQAVDALASVMPDLLRAISDALSRKCVANLQPLRGILATYRMSSKQAPSTHSSFVPKILRPLRTFLREQDAPVAAEDKSQVAKDVAETTAAEYCAMATDLLQRNKSSEATLRRLNIGRGGAAGGATGGAVVEKIAMQLFLDVEKFGDEMASIGIDAASIPSFTSLRSMVKRERSEMVKGGAIDNSTENEN